MCTRKGSIGGSSGFTGRKDENGTLTCHFFRGELWRIHSGLPKIITKEIIGKMGIQQFNKK